MARKKEKRAGYGKLLDAWVAPEGAGHPAGCVATSFTFSPVFFEEECLGRFLQLETDPGQDGPLHLVEREEKLSQVICAAALVDQHHCKGSRSLRWDLLPARPRGGVLHAKVALLHWSRLVRVIIASANLTEDGYRRNQEIFGVLDYKVGGEAPLTCLSQVVEFLRQAARYSQPVSEPASPALARWNALLDHVGDLPRDWGVEDEKAERSSTRVHALLIGPSSPNAFEALSQLWPGSGPPTEAHIVSPFFDPPGQTNRPAEGIWQILRRRGEASVSFYVTAEKTPGESALFVHAPESLRLAEPRGRQQVYTQIYHIKLEEGRPLHAKGIWLEDARWAAYMIGSSNFTSAGLGLTGQPNLEANLVYCADWEKSRTAYGDLAKSFPDGERINSSGDIRWQAQTEEGEDSPGDEVFLPEAFASAVYDCDERQRASVTFAFAGQPPSGWALIDDEDDLVVYDEAQWHQGACPPTVCLPWPKPRPPSGFRVRWKGSEGRAWWPVNVASTTSLPPPQELRDLPLEVLVDILTSARPLHRALSDYLKRRKAGQPGAESEPPIVDPRKRVDTSQFLLQRTRRVSSALNALRERLERPAPTQECIDWRLRGPVGVLAFAMALCREARSEEERAFLLSELALEIHRAKPESAPGCLPKEQVFSELTQVVKEILALVPKGPLEARDQLGRYLHVVFEAILR